MNKSGFVLVSFIPVLMALVAMMIAVVALVLGYFPHWRLQKDCWERAWQRQTQVREELRELLSLNPQALGLRTERQRARKMLRAARASAQVPAILAAEAYRASVILRQRSLQAQQQMILNRSRVSNQVFKYNLNRLLNGKVHSQDVRVAELQVQAKPIGSISPSYFTQPRFNQAQSIRIRWQTSLGQSLPQVFRSWLRQRVPLVRGACQVAIYERSSQRWDIQSRIRP